MHAIHIGDVMMIEGDIMLLGQDTPNQTDIPIMAHNVGDYNNLTFEQWLDEIIKVGWNPFLFAFVIYVYKYY